MKKFARSHSLRFLLLGSVALWPDTGLEAQGLSVWETPEYFRSGALAQINAAQAYARGFTGAGVLVGVADSGLDARHPEFYGRLVPGFDFLTNKPILPGNAGTDTSDHGTHVAGIVAATRDGVGMHGVAFGAAVIPAKLGTGYDFNLEKYFSSTWEFLTAQGATVINNSFSANKECADSPPCNVTHYSRTDVETTFPTLIARARNAVAGGTLMVFAAGNESQSSPDVLAALPTLIPELEKGWLVAVAVDAGNQITSYSDRCGVAKNYCLAAPGNLYSTTWLGRSGPEPKGYQTMQGTSQAAPVISGVAALVKQAFPWFTAHDLQQVLLTTATDLGARGVDDVYGWGLVNAGKAVLGYGMFTGTTILDTRGMTSVFTNDISGAGSLVKTGSGELILTGANTYAGGTVVEGGTLSVNGSVASAVMVGTGGALRGTGTINAPVVVAGVLAPGGSPGTMTVAGPVNFLPSGTFRVDIDGTGIGAGAGNYSRLLTTGANGAVNVAGTLAPVLRGITGSADNTYTPPLGTNFTVIQASGGLSGSFSRLEQPVDGLAVATRIDALYGTHSLNLIVTPAAYGNLLANGFLTTANADAVGRALDSARPAAGVAMSGPLAALYTGLYTLDPSALPTALRLLSGEIHATTGAMMFQEARHVRTAINGRLDDAWARPTRSAAAPLAPGLNATVWATGYGGWGSVSGEASTRLSWTQSGFLAGVDALVTDALRLGVAAGQGRSSGGLRELASNANSSHVDLSVYGATQFHGLNAKFGAAYGWNDISTERAVAFGAFGSTLTGNYDGRIAQVFGELSRPWQMGAVTTAPFAAIVHVDQRLDGFQEAGGGAALGGQGQSLSTTISTLGASFGVDIPLREGLLTSSARLGWQHAFGDVDAHATMALSGSVPFTATYTAIARDALVVGLGLSYEVAANVTARLAYDGVLASDAQNSTVKGDVQIRF